LALSITISTVFADLGSWSTHMFAVNISGTSDGISGKMVNDPVGAIWAANILTYVDGPQISLNLGWNWFSGTEKCGTVFTQNVQGDPYYAYTYERASTLFLTAQPCGSIRYGLSGGKHIVTAGGTNYYDTWTATEVIP
jgi:hypothetical protein